MRRTLPSRLLIGFAFAVCLAVAAGGMRSPGGHLKRNDSPGQGATTASVPSSSILKADQHDQLGRNSFSGHAPLPRLGTPVRARRATWSAVSSAPSRTGLAIDLAPLYRRPPPSFST
jgi:hypothetical protein